MRGMLLDFAGEATIEAAATEYVLTHRPGGDWVLYVEARDQLAQLIEAGKGIPRESTLEYLTQVYGAPQFKSPAQRRWFFATHPETAPKKPAGEGKPTGDRWQEIIQAARNAVRVQPEITGTELISAINGSIEPDLTGQEETRVQELVSPERQKQLVAPPERVPKEERTPEIVELIEQEWSRIEKERGEAKERKKEMEPAKGPGRKPQRSPGKEMVPPFVQPGIPYRGAAKKGYMSARDYFYCQYSDIADASHWRAFLQATTLIRSEAEDKEIRCTLESEYPDVEVEEVLKAAKGFVKKGFKDPYVEGRALALRFIRQGSSSEFITSVYRNMERGKVNPLYLSGFRGGFGLSA